MRKGIVSALMLTAACGLILTPAIIAGQEEAEQTEPTTERAIDPVCNIAVQRDPDLSAEYQGKTYYFCMKADMEAFKKDPEKYLEGSDHTHPDPQG